MKKATVWHNLSFNGRASVKWRKIETHSEFLNAFANTSGPRLDTYKGFPYNTTVQQSCEPRYLVDDDDRWRVEIQNIPKKCSQTLPETNDNLRRYSQHFFLAGRKSQEKSAEKSAQQVPIKLTDRQAVTWANMDWRWNMQNKISIW